jgi:hypothetical protein
MKVHEEIHETARGHRCIIWKRQCGLEKIPGSLMAFNKLHTKHGWVWGKAKEIWSQISYLYISKNIKANQICYWIFLSMNFGIKVINKLIFLWTQSKVNKNLGISIKFKRN